MVKAIHPESACDLPFDFVAKHDKARASRSQPADFCTKEEYLDLMGKVREATLKALAQVPQGDLSKPGPEAMRSYAPKVGSVFLAIANHEMMHSGQVAVVRRVLSKPVVI
jgi:carboxylesterase type B